VASWDHFRIPIAIAAIDPARKGHQNSLFRQMLKDFKPPAWVREVVVVADAGYPANLTLKLIEELTFRTLCRSAKACLGNTRKTGSGSQSMRILSPIVWNNIVP
jgi:hypothetical protein